MRSKQRSFTARGLAASVLSAATILASLTPDSVSAGGYAGSSSITEWNGQCGGSTRHWWDDMCMAWRKKMGDKGWVQWWRNYNLFQAPRYSDADAVWWGNDDATSGLDWNDAGLLCTHGGYDATRWFGVPYDQGPDGACGISADKMSFGNDSGGWLNFLHLSSCNSVRYSQRTQWFDAAAGLHLVTGFHGLMYIGSQYVDEYRDLANHGMSARGVGKEWLDHMHHVDHWYNSYATVCPMSIGFGATVQEAQSRHDETYNAFNSDPVANWMNTRWKSGCDPDDGPKLPN